MHVFATYSDVFRFCDQLVTKDYADNGAAMHTMPDYLEVSAPCPQGNKATKNPQPVKAGDSFDQVSCSGRQADCLRYRQEFCANLILDKSA